MTLDELIDTFSFLDDWMEKYRVIIELGKTLPELPEEAKVPANKVLGCQSQVWLVEGGRLPDGGVEFVADSDAHIVRGLVAIVFMIFSGKRPEEIAALDPRPIFEELGLDQHLSQGRSNGLLSMVGRIKQIASEIAAAQVGG
ncbi:MAG: SufE family protein [Polyangiaceae bacterium]|nr:SufE family protein [Polyangiaceae bacterium]